MVIAYTLCQSLRRQWTAPENIVVRDPMREGSSCRQLAPEGDEQAPPNSPNRKHVVSVVTVVRQTIVLYAVYADARSDMKRKKTKRWGVSC